MTKHEDKPLTAIRERYESSMSETAFTDAICAAYDLGRLNAALPSGEPPQPRCPKCGKQQLYFAPEKTPEGLAILKCWDCFSIWHVDNNNLQFLAQFFGPSAPQPQPCCDFTGEHWLGCPNAGTSNTSVATSGSAGQEPLEYVREAVRFEDMSPDGRLSLFREDDGDVIITAIPPSSSNRPRVSVQFCTYSGGGQSQRTLQALYVLMAAMQADNKERTQGEPEGRAESAVEPGRCCDNGRFGDDHECQKLKPAEPQSEAQHRSGIAAYGTTLNVLAEIDKQKAAAQPVAATDNRMRCKECKEPVCDHLAAKLIPWLENYMQPVAANPPKGEAMFFCGDCNAPYKLDGQAWPQMWYPTCLHKNPMFRPPAFAAWLQDVSASLFA